MEGGENAYPDTIHYRYATLFKNCSLNYFSLLGACFLPEFREAFDEG